MGRRNGTRLHGEGRGLGWRNGKSGPKASGKPHTDPALLLSLQHEYGKSPARLSSGLPHQSAG
jgi:hypothetical protein